MFIPVRFFISFMLLCGLFLAPGCQSAPAKANDSVEIRAASTSEHTHWQKADVHVAGLNTWVDPNPAIVLSDIAFARESVDDFGHPIVALVFTSSGAAKMAVLSKERMSRPVAIFLDGRIIAAPIVMKPVSETFVVNFGNVHDGRKVASALADRVNESKHDW